MFSQFVVMMNIGSECASDLVTFNRFVFRRNIGSESASDLGV